MKSGWAAVILIAAGIVAYANTAKNGLFWDDDEFITRNAYIRSFRYLPQWFSQPLTAGAGVNSNYYRPLLQLSFAIDYKLWKLWPVGYHLENMAWHTFAGILLYSFIHELSRTKKDAGKRKGSEKLEWMETGEREFLASQPQPHSPSIAFITALLWLVHPVHVEAVAYANSRGDSMAAAFILLTLILWMKGRFWASAATFVLALLSKEFAIVTPGLIILLEFMKHQIPNAKSQTISKSQSQNSKQARQSGSLRNFQDAGGVGVEKFRKLLTDNYIDDRRSSLIYITNLASKKLYRLLTIVVNLYNFIKPILPQITIAVIYLILRFTVFNFQNTLNFYGMDLTKVDQNQPLAQYATSVPVRLMTFLKVLPIYGRILVWPNDLHMERTVEVATAISDPVVLASLAGLLIAILLFCYLAILKKRPVVLFAAGWFFISILPVSGIIPISQILAEHFLYLPSIGFFILIAFFVTSISSIISTILSQKTQHTQRTRGSDIPGKSENQIRCSDSLILRHPDSPSFPSVLKNISLVALMTLITTPLLIKTIRQNKVWRDPITFYEYTLSKTTPTARVYNNLAMAYADAGEHQKAIENYQAAIAMGDIYPNPHYNLGNTLMEMGKLDEAEREYRRALEIDPNFHYATLKLGQMYIDQGKIDAAKKLVCPVFPSQPLCRHY